MIDFYDNSKVIEEMKFRESVVIVTGAGRGLGRSVAIAYASKRAKVVIAEKDPVTGGETEQ